jgi:hypothetical protein
MTRFGNSLKFSIACGLVLTMLCYSLPVGLYHIGRFFELIPINRTMNSAGGHLALLAIFSAIILPRLIWISMSHIEVEQRSEPTRTLPIPRLAYLESAGAESFRSASTSLGTTRSQHRRRPSHWQAR